jgi:hypothetical protein
MLPRVVNPFVFSTPVPPLDLIDRDREARLLLELAEGGHNVRLAAPRRYGKTSLLTRLVADAEAAGMNAVLVDLFGVVTRADLALRLEDGYRGLRGPVARGIERLLRDARVRAGITGAFVELEKASPERADRFLLELLDVPARASERTERRTLVVLDEFQEVLHAGDRLDALMRSRLQHQGATVSYVFAGSQPGLLAALFGERDRPLYGQARAIGLAPLADGDVAAYVDARFAATGREAGRALDYLLEVARGHPQRTMLLAHHLWEATPPGAAADEAAWERARDAAFTELAEALPAAWEGFDDTERRVLAALAGGGTALLARDTLERFSLSRGSAARARDRLIAAGDLRHADGRLELVDPLLSGWIRAGRRAPG